ncbi:MAG: hypothetical protein ACXWOV_16785 [Isosphaeraceae bacterium]
MGNGSCDSDSKATRSPEAGSSRTLFRREIRAHEAAGEPLERGSLSLAWHGQDRRRRRGQQGIGEGVSGLLPSFPRQRASQDGPFRHMTSGRLRGPRTGYEEQCARQGKNQQVILVLAS